METYSAFRKNLNEDNGLVLVFVLNSYLITGTDSKCNSEYASLILLIYFMR